MSSENNDNRERLSKEELDRAMQERREKRAKARAKKDKRSGKSGTSAKTSASHTHAAKSAKPDLKGLLPKKETPKKDKKKTRTAAAKASAAKSASAKGFRPYACLLLGPIFALFEILLTVLTGSGFLHVGVLNAFGLGLLLGAVCSLFAEKISFILEAVVLEIFTIAFLVEYFIYNSYRVFMSKTDIATGAGDVVTGFGGVVVGLILRGIPIILLFHVPLALMIWRRKDLGFRKPMNFRPAGVQALAGVVLLILGALFAGIGGREGNFSSDVQTKGLIYATGKDLRGGYELDMEAALDAPDVLSAAHGTGSSSGPSFFGLNKLNVDLDALIASSSGNIKAAHQYVQQQKPSPKNEYTGLFAGKNLIFITAEAFSEELISEELTPALYRMATKGINFNDYYQPAWGGSTSTGEYSNMMGIVPMDGVNSIQDTIGKDNSINIFHKLRSLGYFSECYHNGLYDYYGRNKTHTGLGFDNFIAKGNGMEDYLLDVWPDSDLEMMKYTMTRYMDHQPFSVYYMSISGHTNYAWSANAMSKKNRDAVAELPYSEQVKGYFACNLELEYAMEYVIQTLEEAGIANDTVIVLGTDHYPYGLEKSAAWGTDKDYLQELYGYAYQTPKERDHSRLLIWSGCLEESDPIQIDFPTYSLDIQPTLCNLFGVDYDSRLFVGQDVFSEEDPLVLWTNGSFLTDKGYYYGGKWTDADPAQPASQDYINAMRSKVQGKLSYSKLVLSTDYFRSFNAGVIPSAPKTEDTAPAPETGE